MRIKIEKLKKKDLPIFYKLFKKSLFEDFKEYSPEVAEFQYKRLRKNILLKAIKTGEQSVFVAKNKDQIAGIMMTAKPVGGVSECYWLIIAPDFRGQGIGTKMLGFWEKLAKKAKCHLLILTADQKNLKFYNKFGFSEYGFMAKGYFNDDDHLLSKKIGDWNNKSLEG